MNRISLSTFAHIPDYLRQTTAFKNRTEAVARARELDLIVAWTTVAPNLASGPAHQRSIRARAFRTFHPLAISPQPYPPTHFGIDTSIPLIADMLVCT